MRLKSLLLLAAGASVALSACERVVSITVPDAPRRLVVEARLERGLDFVPGAQAVQLSTTANYFSGDYPPPATGATVRVTDDLNRSTMFMETIVPGTYEAPVSFTVGRTRKYTLSIDFEGQRYTATDSTRQVPRIANLEFDLPNGGRYAGTKGLRAGITYTDTPNVRNFYLWEQYVNNVRQAGPDTAVRMRLIGNDLINDGLRVDGFQPFEGIDIPFGAAVLIRQIAISEHMYRYYFALNDQLNSDGSPFAVPPASVRGNVQNTTTPSMPALGYFSVSEVSERRAIQQVALPGPITPNDPTRSVSGPPR
ncbi:MAG: DUF4249 domain-containing protein [Gemmatimonadaceae bacterium]